MLARDGHEVLVLERDDLSPAADVETAASRGFRVAAPQIVQPHVLQALGWTILGTRLPDVLAALLGAGAPTASVVSQLPPTVTDCSAAPEDERMPLVMTRRSTLDWVLMRAAAAEPRVELRYRTAVTGLVADPGKPPRVRGVRTADGVVPADIVIDAAGRRTALDRWLLGIGAQRSRLSRAECGLAYYGRQYVIVGRAPGPVTTRVVAGLDEFTVGIWGGDNATMQMAVAPLASDRRFLPARDPAVFTSVLRTIPFYADWLDALKPINAVSVMGGLHNTLRRLVVGSGPVVLGLHAVGDSVCTTNPTFGRGLSMAARTAADLSDVLAEYPDDPHRQAEAMDRAVTAHIAPWYADQAETDAARLALLRHTVADGPAPVPMDDPHRVTFAQLRRAALVDADAFRAVWRLMSMIGHPAEIYENSALGARVRALPSGETLTPIRQPSRLELEAALAGAA
jgi:flavin-dependent dehydrogenase